MADPNQALDKTCPALGANEVRITSEGRIFVDHNYHDFSDYLGEQGNILKRKKACTTFPEKLHKMLSNPQFSHIIAWMPHGRAFKILNKKLLMEEAAPTYFYQSKFQSFTRQLNGWGFKRLYKSGANFGCYYHECFLFNLPELTRLMIRVSPHHQGKPIPCPEEEPDLFLISRSHPLAAPTVPSSKKNCNTAEVHIKFKASSALLPVLERLEPLPYLPTNLTANDLQHDCCEYSSHFVHQLSEYLQQGSDDGLCQSLSSGEK